MISLEEALRERPSDGERVDTVTLAGALRAALPHLEAECDQALGLLAQAQADLTRARTAGLPWRVELAEQTARLARTAVDVAARQVALRRAELIALEHERGAEETTRMSSPAPIEASPRLTVTLIRRLAQSRAEDAPPAAAWAVVATEAAGALPVFEARAAAARVRVESAVAHQRAVLEGAAGLRDRAPESLTDPERATLREAAHLLAQRYRIEEDDGLGRDVARLARGGAAVSVVVRTTTLEVWISPAATEEEPFPEPVRDLTAYAASVSLGFDQRTAEATIRRTGGGTIDVGYWSAVEVRMGATPGTVDGEDRPPVRFRGYVIPVDNTLYPIDNVLTCKGRLYRAVFVRNTKVGGTVMVPLDGSGRSDEQQVTDVLIACGVSSLPGQIGGTGKALGSLFIDLQNVLPPGPFTWAEGQSGLDYIERLDEVSVPDDASGRYRTFETVDGTVFRTLLATTPAGTPDFSFTEGEDVLEARITRDPAGAANVVTVTGAPMPLKVDVGGGETEVVLSAQGRFTAGSAFAPYLPPGLPVGPGGFPAVAQSFSSPMIEKGELADPDFAEDVISCEQVAQFLLTEYNCVVDTLEFSTPRDDVLGPGQTIHLHSPRLGITDAAQHYWLQHLEITFDERGAITQRLRCLRKS